MGYVLSIAHLHGVTRLGNSWPAGLRHGFQSQTDSHQAVLLSREHPDAQNQGEQEAHSNDDIGRSSVTRISRRAQARVALCEQSWSTVFTQQSRADSFAPGARCPRNTAQGSQNLPARFQAHPQQHLAGRGCAYGGAASAAPFECFLPRWESTDTSSEIHIETRWNGRNRYFPVRYRFRKVLKRCKQKTLGRGGGDRIVK